MRAAVITDRLAEVEATRDGDRLIVAEADLDAATGWHLEDRGLCRGDVCVPVRDRAALVTDAGIDLAVLAGTLGQVCVVDTDEGVAALTSSSEDTGRSLASLTAPRVTLESLDGHEYELPGPAGKKKLIVAWASW